MSRTLPPREGDSSPWGMIDSALPLGPDAISVSTPSHGGIWVSPSGMAKIPEPLRATAYSGDGWFGEDCDWCIPYQALGLHAFEPTAVLQAANRDAARRTLERCHARYADLLDIGATRAARRGASHG
jgi:hypothetical protein